MGKYNGAVITAAGQNLIAQAIAESKTVTFTTAQASSHVYPSSTDFEALTALTDIEKTVDINYAGVYSDTVVQVSARFDNDGVETAYLINTLGFFAQLGTDTPILFAVSTAVTPDQMPVFDADNPSAFIYNMQMTVQNADSINLSVNPAGTVTVEQLNDAINVVETHIGDLSDLTTDDKTSLVNAVNEVKAYTGTIQGLVIDAIYPIGSLYMSINNTMPSALAEGKTWELLSGNYVLKTISSGTGGQTSNAGETGSTTLTAAQSGVPAHSHGMTQPAYSVSGGYVSGGISGGIHQHSYNAFADGVAGGGIYGAGGLPFALVSATTAYGGGSHTHDLPNHTHTVTQTANASVNNNAAANASQGHTHTAGMPRNIGVYVWKRIA